MKFVKINAGGLAEIVELEGQDTIDYKKMKELLGFDSPVTVVERKIMGEYYDLWLDDEGLLKDSDERIISGVLVSREGTEYLIGNILILRHDDEGNSIGLNEEQIDKVMFGRNMVDMDDLSDFEGKDKNRDRRIYGYFDNGYLIAKAHSQIIVYEL